MLLAACSVSLPPLESRAFLICWQTLGWVDSTKDTKSWEFPHSPHLARS